MSVSSAGERQSRASQTVSICGAKRAERHRKRHEKRELGRVLACEGEGQSVRRDDLRRRQYCQISNVRQNVQNLFDG